MRITRSSRPASAGVSNTFELTQAGNRANDISDVKAPVSVEYDASTAMGSRKPRARVRPPHPDKCVGILENKNKRDAEPQQGQGYLFVALASTRSPAFDALPANSIILASFRPPVGRPAAFVVPEAFRRLRNNLEQNPPVLSDEIALLGSGLSEFLSGDIANDKDGA